MSQHFTAALYHFNASINSDVSFATVRAVIVFECTLAFGGVTDYRRLQNTVFTNASQFARDHRATENHADSYSLSPKMRP
jgi:hypothetical protein